MGVLTPEEAYEILDFLTATYATKAFQDELRKAWKDAGDKRLKKVAASRAICSKHVYPLITRYGFEASAAGQCQMFSECSKALGQFSLATENSALIQWLLDPDVQEEKPMSTSDLMSLLSKGSTGWAPSSKAVAARAKLAARYERDGFVAPLVALTPREVASTLAAYKRFQEEHQPRLNRSTSNGMNHAWLPWLRDLARHPAILSAVAEALGSRNLYLWTSEFFARAPGKSQESGTGIGWHKDAEASISRLHPVDRRHYVTALLALSPCDRHHGCLMARPTPPGSRGAEGKEVYLELEPGEISLHGPSTPHMGGLNASEETRYCIALRYIRASVRDRDSERLGRNMAFLVSGEDDHNNFDLMPEVPGEATEDGMELRERIIRRREVSGTLHSNWAWGMQLS